MVEFAALKEEVEQKEETPHKEKEEEEEEKAQQEGFRYSQPVVSGRQE